MHRARGLDSLRIRVFDGLCLRMEPSWNIWIMIHPNCWKFTYVLLDFFSCRPWIMVLDDETFVYTVSFVHISPFVNPRIEHGQWNSGKKFLSQKSLLCMSRLNFGRRCVSRKPTRWISCSFGVSFLTSRTRNVNLSLQLYEFPHQRVVPLCILVVSEGELRLRIRVLGVLSLLYIQSRIEPSFVWTIINLILFFTTMRLLLIWMSLLDFLRCLGYDIWCTHTSRIGFAIRLRNFRGASSSPVIIRFERTVWNSSQISDDRQGKTSWCSSYIHPQLSWKTMSKWKKREPSLEREEPSFTVVWRSNRFFLALLLPLSLSLPHTHAYSSIPSLWISVFL